MKSKTAIPLIVLLVALLMLAAACNLSTNPEPPTLVPRMTDTPLPTIAYETVEPPTQPESPVTNQANPQTAKIAMNALLDQVDVDSLFMHISSLQNLGTRHVNSPDLPNSGAAASYRYVRGQFDTIAAQSQGRFSVVDQPFTVKWAGVETTQRNVVGIISGSVTGGGIILIGAHYDSISIDPNDFNYPAPGANDNASGVAALIEMASILAQRPHRATIVFVAFAAEEVGRMGSRAFVNEYRTIIPPNYMFNLDIIGSSTGPNGQVVDNQMRIFSAGPETSLSRQLARAVYWIDFTMTPDMQIILQDGEDRVGRYSDHMSFTEAGFPAIRFIESLEDQGRQHTPADVIGDIQANYLRRTTQSILAAVSVMADGLPPPRDIVLRSGEGTKRTLVWEPIPGATGYKIGLRDPGSLIINREFPWNTNSVEWDGFYPQVVAGLVISAIDENGMMGPPSVEYIVPP